MKFRTLLLGHLDDHAIARIPDTLDRMDPKSRRWTVQSMSRADFEKVWEIFGQELPTLEDFVPADVGDLEEVIHDGVNSMSAFRIFAKRFTRGPEGHVFGYNDQTWRAVTGPGYFCVDPEHPDEKFVFDYTRLPSQKPATWPELQDNQRGLGRFVYGKMIDSVRKVSEHVSIGRVIKAGQPQDVWFALCRREPGQS